MAELFRSDLKNLKKPATNVPVRKHMMCLNESWLDPFPVIREKLLRRLKQVHLNRYFSDVTAELHYALADYAGYGVSTQQIVWGNGADDILYHIFLAVREDNESFALSPAPSYFDYKTFCRAVGLNIRFQDLNQDFSLNFKTFIDQAQDTNCKLVIVCNPNNPTGNLISEEDILTILNEVTDKPVLVDETYYEFSGQTLLPYLDIYPHLILVRSFSKAFSSAGLRFGYAISNEDNINQVKKVMTTFHSSILIQSFALTILENKTEFLNQVEDIKKERDAVYLSLQKINGITVHPTSTNFLIFSAQEKSGELFTYLKANEVAVRDIGAHPLLKNFLRVTISNAEDNSLFLEVVRRFCQ